MKIAYITDTQESIPPNKYGGIEWMVHHMSTMLTNKGHDVTVYGVPQSQASLNYKVHSIETTALRDSNIAKDNFKLRDILINRNLSRAAAHIQLQNYDIVHNHAGRNFLYFAPFLKKQTMVHTTHSTLLQDYQKTLFEEYPTHKLISISLRQQQLTPTIHYTANVYNAIDVEQYPFCENPQGAYMSFLGRISQQKGVLEAIKVANDTKQFLDIVAIYDPLTDSDYYAEMERMLGDYARYLGEYSLQPKITFLQNSKVFLFPTQWEEPFGLVLLEAMACGVPVIAFDKGAVPEIIEDGKTGYIIASSQQDEGKYTVPTWGIKGMKEAVRKIYSMNGVEYAQMRRSCRNLVESKFHITTMVDNYERAYSDILSKSTND